MTQNEIIAKVRLIMNEAGENQVLSLLNEDSIKLDEYIKGCIPDAVNIIASNSNYLCVNKKSKTDFADSEIKNNEDGSGYIILPKDYISLVAIRMNGWSRIVVKAANEGSELAIAQHNKYTRAGKCKPVCVLTKNESGESVLEFYSVEGIPKVSLFLYEAKYIDAIPGGAEEPISVAVCYMCASLVYSIFENKDTAAQMKNIAVELIPKE